MDIPYCYHGSHCKYLEEGYCRFYHTRAEKKALKRRLKRKNNKFFNTYKHSNKKYENIYGFAQENLREKHSNFLWEKNHDAYIYEKTYVVRREENLPEKHSNFSLEKDQPILSDALVAQFKENPVFDEEKKDSNPLEQNVLNSDLKREMEKPTPSLTKRKYIFDYYIPMKQTKISPLSSQNAEIMNFSEKTQKSSSSLTGGADLLNKENCPPSMLCMYCSGLLTTKEKAYYCKDCFKRITPGLAQRYNNSLLPSKELIQNQPYQKVSKSKIQEFLKERNITVSGTKMDLWVKAREVLGFVADDSDEEFRKKFVKENDSDEEFRKRFVSKAVKIYSEELQESFVEFKKNGFPGLKSAEQNYKKFHIQVDRSNIEKMKVDDLKEACLERGLIQINENELEKDELQERILRFLCFD